MDKTRLLNYLKDVLNNLPNDWTRLTTHRLDIYNEELAKREFLSEFELLFDKENSDQTELANLPTAYDYIRLGHPLSSVLEWAIAKLNGFKHEEVISFSSQTTPILSILRKNLFDQKETHIYHLGALPSFIDPDLIKKVYGYSFSLTAIENVDEIKRTGNASNLLIGEKADYTQIKLPNTIDFSLCLENGLGSALLVNSAAHSDNVNYISEIQHVRRRETIAMTPADSLTALQNLVKNDSYKAESFNLAADKASVLDSIAKITHVNTKAVVGSSGLSIQYAIMMGLIQNAVNTHPEKAIKIIVPPNCYGGTNDQARRVAACLPNVEIMDLPVDVENDMVQSVNRVLDAVAKEDAVPYIIAEIPTNPRVEVPDLNALKEALSKERYTPDGNSAVDPVFILDQTFCPNVNFLGEGQILSSVRTISYVSGSKFPSGGKCTAGYCTANQKGAALMDEIEENIQLCDNEATPLQMSILAEQLPSMLQRIEDAYKNTREFVSFIEETLPSAKINFVSEELAAEGFTPSVFSLDLPTKGNSDEEREAYKRELNLKLIDLMISEIPHESKYCVSYGQLKGCYWTIPATSTQGTTKEGDKDYIARVALSADMDLEKHKQVFNQFVDSI